MSNQLNQSKQVTAVISQDTFPGAWIEPLWSRVDLIKKAPMYAVRLALEAEVIQAPQGRTDYVSLIFDGTEYILAKQNFEWVKALTHLFLTDFIKLRGYSAMLVREGRVALRYQPNLIIDGISYMLDQAVRLYDIPMDKVRMFWIIPDEGPCGEYRSAKPQRYASQNEDYYCERSANANYSMLAWFDVFMMHRAPPPSMLNLYKKIHQTGKTLVFEIDDDLWNIPAWNHNKKHYTPEVLARLATSIEMADVCIGSTQELCDILSDRVSSGKVFLGPNLVDLNDFAGPNRPPLLDGQKFFPPGRELGKYDGYKPRRHTGGRVDFVCVGKPVLDRIDEDEYNPVTVMWAGSNTHDKDVEPLVAPIKSLGQKHGLGVRFVFFGYCPPDFIEVTTEAGNTATKWAVKPEYQHFIQYIPGVPYGKYISALKDIDPDIALCPLTSESFNRSKSNLRILEMGALGAAVVATDFGPYQFIDHDHEGLKIPVANRNGDWYEAIESLISNMNYRVELASNLSLKVTREHSWNHDSQNRRLWDSIFTRIKEVSVAKRALIEDKIIAQEEGRDGAS